MSGQPSAASSIDRRLALPLMSPLGTFCLLASILVLSAFQFPVIQPIAERRIQCLDSSTFLPIFVRNI
jgi:hypothetical protein